MRRYSQHLWKGVIFAIIAAFLFSLLGVTVKLSVNRLPVTMVTCFRQLFGLISMSPVMLALAHRHGTVALKTNHFRLHVWRTIFSLGTMYLLTTAIWLIPLSDAILLSYTRPIFVPIIVWIWMRRRIEKWVWVGIVLAFVGVAVILKPEGSYSFDVGTILGLLSGVTGAIAVLTVRKLGKTEPAPRMVTYYFLLGGIISIVPVLFTWQTPTAFGWWSLVILGLLAAIYQTFLSLSYRHGRATIVSCVLYLSVLFTVSWDWLLWEQTPDLWSALGMVLVCIGAVTAIGGRQAKFAPGEQPVARRGDEEDDNTTPKS